MSGFFVPHDLKAPLKGAALIKDEVKRLPDAPGVYRMIGDEGEAHGEGNFGSIWRFS